MANRTLRLVVFDFDGVITDSEAAHFEALRRVLEPIGVQLTWQQYCDTYLAYTDREAVQMVLMDTQRNPTPEVVDELVEKKRIEFADFLESNLKLFPGVLALLKNLQKHRIPCGICSGSTRSEIEFVLQHSKISEYFRFIVSADDIQRSKPDPEAYRLSMKIGSQFCNHDEALSPLECIAIEDSVGGIQAAKAAGMFCLGITNSYPADLLRQADVVVDELTTVDTDFLMQLLE